MRLVIAFATAAVVVGVLVEASTKAGTSPDTPPLARRGAAIDRILLDVSRGSAPGALAVVHEFDRVWRGARGLAVRDGRVALRPSDRFRIDSVTKVFIATLVLQLVAADALKLEHPVERFLPGLLPAGDRIRVRHLLNHTSGLFEYMEDRAVLAPYERDASYLWQPRDLVALAANRPLLHAPGARWAYSNTNYVVLGAHRRRSGRRAAFRAAPQADLRTVGSATNDVRDHASCRRSLHARLHPGPERPTRGHQRR